MKTKTIKEIWKPIYRGWYEVSNMGRVRRLKPSDDPKLGRVLKPTICNGYEQVKLYVGNNRIFKGNKGPRLHRRVNRLVAQAFLGSCPPRIQVDHIDGNRMNNQADNLRHASARNNNLYGRLRKLRR